jgi:outer membrane protein assembly factor BamB
MVLTSWAVPLGLRFAWSEDQPQWGQRHTRNMISHERGLADDFDPVTGTNIRWSVELGSDAYSSPVVAQGRVFIGTNNSSPQDPRHQGDRGVLLCLGEQDGSLVWQLVVPRLIGEDGYLDQPNIGFCSPPTVEGNRAYVVTNRHEVVCLDLKGQADGNDGPYQDEGQHMVQPGEAALEVTAQDADILWLYDMIAECGIHPHDSAHSSILVDGRFLYVNTGNGVDHRDHARTFIPKPDAPSLIVLDKETGQLVAEDAEQIGPRIFHCTWSSPALGDVNGRSLVFFCGGDGVVYAFVAVPQDADTRQVQKLERVWRYDCDPTAPKDDVHSYYLNKQEGPSNIMGAPVFYQNRIYVTGGGDFWWGKSAAWVQCIDATQQGDITESGRVWSRPLRQHSCTTPAIWNDLVFVGDLGRRVYCLDAQSGDEHWSHGMNGPVWSSILAADGKVYVGSHGQDLCIFDASPDKQLRATIRLDDKMSSSPAAANGVIYVNTLATLYAIRAENR